MRGTGAVIHFRPPTDSSMPSPDLSGRWNSIRGWFSLPVQDEAAQCFRVFYQPNEATSPSDRLKNFLKLKALASPGRQDNFTTERILGTSTGRLRFLPVPSGLNRCFPCCRLFRQNIPDRSKIIFDTLMNPFSAVINEKFSQGLFHSPPAFTADPRNFCQPAFRDSSSGLPVIEHQQQIGSMFLGRKVHGVRQIISDVKLHVWKCGHKASLRSFPGDLKT